MNNNFPRKQLFISTPVCKVNSRSTNDREKMSMTKDIILCFGPTIKMKSFEPCLIGRSLYELTVKKCFIILKRGLLFKMVDDFVGHWECWKVLKALVIYVMDLNGHGMMVMRIDYSTHILSKKHFSRLNIEKYKCNDC